MKTVLMTVTAAALLIGLAGCAANPIVGHGATQAGRYHGDVGVAGNGTTLTMKAGSKVDKLSIVGDGCKVTVDEGAEVSKIEFWGNGNTVTIPDSLEVSIAAMGTNQVIRRPLADAPADQSDPQASTPDE